MIMLAGKWERPRRATISAAVRFEVLRRDGYTCRYCGAHPPDVALHLDHVVAVANGGTNDPANLVTACVRCNVGKGISSAEPGGPKFEPVIPEGDALYGDAYLDYQEYDFVREVDGWEPLL